MYRRKNDFIATYLYQPNISLEEMYANGVTPDNTEIKDFDYYKSNETFQQFFTENGEFNESKAKDFYDGMYEMFNVYAEDDYSKKALEVIESSPRDWTNLDSKKYDPSAKIVVNNLPNRITQGMSIEPVARFTDAEIAQANYVRDENGNVLDWTPNDKGGLWKGIFRDPMALSVYEENGFHEENGVQVYHQKGEVQRDKKGNPFYQLVGSQNTSGKQILKYTDTLTKEGTWINDYDFLDSDGYKKSVAGTIAKTAFQIAPYLFGPTRAIYGGLTAAKELATALPVFLNSINSIISGDNENEFGQKMNRWSNKMQSYKPGMTVDGNDNFMSFENIGNMVASSVGQLYQQRMVGKIPTWFSKNPSSSSIHNMSAAYMALTSAQDSYDSFKAAGATDQVAGLGALASFAAMFGLMKTDYFGQWLTKGTIAETRSLGQQTAQEFARAIAPEAYRTASGKVSTSVARKLFGKYYDKVNKVMHDFVTAGKSGAAMGVGEQFLRRSLNEAVEETTEEITFDAVKGLFGGIESLFDIKLSEEQYERLNFNWSLEEALKRYGAAFLGGAIGGAVFEGVNQLELLNNPQARAFREKDVTKRLVYLYASGQGNDVDEELERLYKKGKLGNKNLSAYKRRVIKGTDGTETEIFEVGSETDNQNLAVHQAIQTEIRNIKHFLNSNRWVASNKELQRKIVDIAIKAKDSGESVKSYMERTGENPIIDVIVDGNFLSFASADIYAQMFEVYELEKKIATRKSEIRTTTQNLNDYEEAVKKDDEIKFLESQIKDQKKLVNDILNGEYADYYIEFGMFAADDVTQERITASENKILENVETYVKIIHGKNYKDLNTEQKFLYKKEWELFKNMKPEAKMKNLFHLFRAVNERVSQVSMEGYSVNPQSDELFDQTMYRDNNDISKLEQEISELTTKLSTIENPKSDEYKDTYLQLVQKQTHYDFIQNVFSENLTDKGRDFISSIIEQGYNEIEYRRHLIDAYEYTITQNNKVAETLENSGVPENIVEASKLRVNVALLTNELDKLKDETVTLPIEPLIQIMKQYHHDIISKGVVRSNDEVAKLVARRVIEMSFIDKFGVNYKLKDSLETIVSKYIELLSLGVPDGLSTKGNVKDLVKNSLYDFITNLQNDPLNIDKYLKKLKDNLSVIWELNIDDADDWAKWMFDENTALLLLFGTKSDVEGYVKDLELDDAEIFEETWTPLSILPLINELLDISTNLHREESTPIEKILQDLFVQIDGRPSEWVSIIASEIVSAKSLPGEYRITDETSKHLDEIESLLNLVTSALDAASNGYNNEANVYRNALKHDLLLEITDDQAAVYIDELVRWKNKINVLRQLAETNKETSERHQTEITLNMDSIYMEHLTKGRIAEKLKELGIDTEDLWKQVIGDESIEFGKIEESDYEHFGELVLKFRQKLYQSFKAKTDPIVDKDEVIEFYDKFIDCFGDDLWMGLNGELSADPEYEPTGNQMLSHFLGIVGQDQDQFGGLWKYAVENDEYKEFTPFSSQLESIRNGLSLALNPTLYNRVNDAIYRTQQKHSDPYVRQRPSIHNLITLLGGPGSGKSSAVGRAIRLMVNALGGEVILSAETKTQLDNLVANVDGNIAHSTKIQLGDLLTEIGFEQNKHIKVNKNGDDSWISLNESFASKGFNRFNPESKPKVLIIDEFTYVNGPAIQALAMTAAASGFTIIGLGDDAQNSLEVEVINADGTKESYPSEIHDVLAHTSPYLTVSMRANNQAQYKNSVILGKVMRDALSSYKLDRTKSVGEISIEENVTLYFNEYEGDIFGIKNDVKPTNEISDAIKSYIERFNKSGKSILVIINDPDNYSSYTDPSDPDRIRIVTPKNAQSLEADYVIIAESNKSNQFDRSRNFNTLVTRAKQATIYITQSKPEGFEFKPLDTGHLPASQLGSEESREKHKTLIMSPYKMDPYEAKEPEGETPAPVVPPVTPPNPPVTPPIIEHNFEIEEDLTPDEIIERYDNREKKELLHDWYRYDRRKEIEASGNPRLSHEKYINWLFGTIGKRWISGNALSPFKGMSLNTDDAQNAIKHIINCLSVYRMYYNSYKRSSDNPGFLSTCDEFISEQLSKLPIEKRKEVRDIINEIVESEGIYYVKGGILYYVYNSNGTQGAIPISKVENIDDGAYSADTTFEYEETLVGLSTEGGQFINVSSYKQNGVYTSRAKVYVSRDGNYDSDDGRTYINASHIPWVKRLTYDNDKDKTDTKTKGEISRIGVQDIMSFAELWPLLQLATEYINSGTLRSEDGIKDPEGNALARLSEILGISKEEIKELRESFSSADAGEQLSADLDFVDRLKKLDLLSNETVTRLSTALFEFIRSDEGEPYRASFYDAIAKYTRTTSKLTLGTDRLNCFDISIKGETEWWPRRFVFRYINQDVAGGTVDFEVREFNPDTHKIDAATVISIQKGDIDWWNWDFLEKIFAHPDFKHLVSTKKVNISGDVQEIESSTSWAVDLPIDVLKAHVDSKNIQIGFGNIQKVSDENKTPRYWPLTTYGFTKLFKKILSGEEEQTAFITGFANFLNNSSKFKHNIYTNIQGIGYINDDSNYKSVSDSQNERLKMDIHSFLLPFYSIKDDRLISDNSLSKETLDYLSSTLKMELTEEDLDSEDSIVIGTWTYNNGVVTFNNGQVNSAFIEENVLDFPFDPNVNRYIVTKITRGSIEINGEEYELKDPSIVDNFKPADTGIFSSDGSVEFKINGQKVNVIVEGKTHECAVLSVGKETVILDLNSQKVYTINKKLNVQPIDDRQYIGILREQLVDGTQAVRVVYATKTPYSYVVHSPGTNFDPSKYEVRDYLGGNWFEGDTQLQNVIFEGSIPESLPKTTGMEISENGDVIGGTYKLLTEVAAKLLNIDTTLGSKSVEIVNLNYYTKTAIIKVGNTKTEVSWKDGITIKNFGFSNRQTGRMINAMNEFKKTISILQQEDVLFAQLDIKMPSSTREVGDCIMLLNQQCKEKEREWGYGYEFVKTGSVVTYTPIRGEEQIIAKFLHSKNIEFKDFVIESISNTAKILVTLQNGEQVKYLLTKENGVWKNMENVSDNSSIYSQLETAILQIAPDADTDTDSDFGKIIESLRNMTANFISINTMWPRSEVPVMPKEILELIQQLPNCDL